MLFSRDQFWDVCYSSYIGVNTESKPLLYADDTSVLITGNNFHDLQIKSVTVLNYMSKSFAVNGLSLNLDISKVLKFSLHHLQDE